MTLTFTYVAEGGYLSIPIKNGDQPETICKIPIPPGLYTSKSITEMARGLIREKGFEMPELEFTLPEPEQKPKPEPIEYIEGKCYCSCSCYSCDAADCPSRI
jgi:hypothetical protein